MWTQVPKRQELHHSAYFFHLSILVPRLSVPSHGWLWLPLDHRIINGITWRYLVGPHRSLPHRQPERQIWFIQIIWVHSGSWTNCIFSCLSHAPVPKMVPRKEGWFLLLLFFPKKKIGMSGDCAVFLIQFTWWIFPAHFWSTFLGGVFWIILIFDLIRFE